MGRKECSLNFRSIHTVALLALLLLAEVAAQAQTYTVLHEFTAAPDGAIPSPIIRDAHGNLYGTTFGGGLASCGEGSCGTVFKVDTSGKETILYDFEGGNDGTNPVAGLIQDSKGNLYGTTRGNGFIGGASVIFKVDPKGQQTVLYVADEDQACCLDSPLARDAQGNLYGMSPFAGDEGCSYISGGIGCGTLFKLSPSGKLTVLHTFHGTEGAQPEGGVVLDAQGNVYGTAFFGGKAGFCHPTNGDYQADGCGTIYKVDSSGKFSVLHSFAGPKDGAGPLGLIIDSAGNLYGIAQWGGDDHHFYNHLYGYGTVFEVDATGKFSVLFTFTPKTTRNNVYANQLLMDSKRNLYGLQQSNNCVHAGGCLFKIDTNGNYTDLYDFQGEGEGDDGSTPMGVVFGSHGDVYGSMFEGGENEPDCQDGCGTVFHLAPFAEP